jgi:hypothetical protein
MSKNIDDYAILNKLLQLKPETSVDESDSFDAKEIENVFAFNDEESYELCLLSNEI